MKIKANLHFHSADDPRDVIDHSFYDGIREASRLGFSALALTCHHKLINPPHYLAFAAEKNILFIPGIEKDIEGRHVVILNPEKNIETVQTFAELEAYKKAHPEIFILAPHPYFGTPYCLGRKLEKNIGLFDAVEQSWFYSKFLNRNERAEAVAKKYNLPYLATSDTHDLSVLDKSYALIDAEEKTIPAIFEAIKNKRFENYSKPSRLFREMLIPTIGGDLRKIRRRLFKK